MSNKTVTEELLHVELLRNGNTYGIRFTINGLPQNVLVVPEVDPLELAQAVYKVCLQLADPIGPCVNEEPY